MVEWIARSRVDGRPIRTTCGTDQQVIRTGVDLAQDTFIIDTVLLKKVSDPIPGIHHQCR